MALPLPDLTADLSGHTPQGFWAALDDYGDEHGYLEPLGDDYAALFIDAGPKLFVTFESEAEIRARPRAHPRGFDHVARNGWSLLTIIARADTWFRGTRLYGYVDRLIDEGFFEDFDATLFFGHHAGGHAAAAYSVAAPGAAVLALRPVATLAPAVVRWDRRYMAHRRRDFTSRFGYAPDMLDAARHAWVAADPAGPDGVHAALFRKPNVSLLRCDYTGPRLARIWDQTGITAPAIEGAMSGTLDTTGFAQLWRARQKNPAYLRTLLRSLEVQGRFAMAERICERGIKTGDADFFVRKLRDIGTRAHAAEARTESTPG